MSCYYNFETPFIIFDHSGREDPAKKGQNSGNTVEDSCRRGSSGILEASRLPIISEEGPRFFSLHAHAAAGATQPNLYARRTGEEISPFLCFLLALSSRERPPTNSPA
jgi:hypothetical protein